MLPKLTNTQNLAIVSASPRRLTIAGKEYPVSKLTPRMAGRIQSLVMDRFPDPRVAARLHMEGLPTEVQTHIWDKACQVPWPPVVGGPEFNAVLMSSEGMALVIELAISPGVAGFSRAEAENLADTMTSEEFDSLLNLISPTKEGNSDPKAPRAKRPRPQLTGA